MLHWRMALPRAPPLFEPELDFFDMMSSDVRRAPCVLDMLYLTPALPIANEWLT